MMQEKYKGGRSHSMILNRSCSKLSINYKIWKWFDILLFILGDVRAGNLMRV